MSAAKQKITVTFHRDGTLQIAVNDGGRPADMSDPRNIANVAGTLAKTSVEMMKEFNRLNTKENESKTSEKNCFAGSGTDSRSTGIAEYATCSTAGNETTEWTQQ